MTINQNYQFSVSDDVLLATLEKDPKEPWGRFSEKLNDAFNSDYLTSEIKIYRAIAEREIDDVGFNRSPVSDNQQIAIVALLRLGKSQKEIAAFVGVSQSAVSRINRFAANIEHVSSLFPKA